MDSSFHSASSVLFYRMQFDCITDTGHYNRRELFSPPTSTISPFLVLFAFPRKLSLGYNFNQDSMEEKKKKIIDTRCSPRQQISSVSRSSSEHSLSGPSSPLLDHHFTAMIASQRECLDAQKRVRQAEWADSMLKNLYGCMSPWVRVMSTLQENRRYEMQQLQREAARSNIIAQAEATANASSPSPPSSSSQEQAGSMSPDEVRHLMADTRRCYDALVHDAAAILSRNNVRHNNYGPRSHAIASQCIGHLCAMLPTSDGVAGALTTLRKARVSNNEEGQLYNFADLHPSGLDESDDPGYYGLALGSSGQLLPISLRADHQKPTKIVAHARQIVRETNSTPCTPSLVRPPTQGQGGSKSFPVASPPLGHPPEPTSFPSWPIQK